MQQKEKAVTKVSLETHAGILAGSFTIDNPACVA